MSAPSEDSRHWKASLATIISMISVVGLTLGLTLPLLAIILERRGVSAAMIGLNTAVQALGLLVVTPFVPRLLRALGTKRFLVTNLAITAATLLALRWFDSLGSWFVLRFLLGVAESGLFTVSEAWINAIAPEGRRGRVMGLYASLLSGAFAIGAGMIHFTGADGWLPFAAGAALTIVAGLPLLLRKSSAPRFEGRPSVRIGGYIRLAPVAIAAAFIYGAIETGVFSLLPPYGLRSGLDVGGSARLIAVLAAGNVLLQYPLGILADRMNRRLLLMICAAAGLFGGITLPLFIHIPWLLWPSLFLWGGVIVGLYTVGLTELGARFKGADLVGANAAFVMVFGLGAITGPPLSGMAMDLWDPHGLAASLALLCLVFIVIAARNRGVSNGVGAGS